MRRNFTDINSEATNSRRRFSHIFGVFLKRNHGILSQTCAKTETLVVIIRGICVTRIRIEICYCITPILSNFSWIYVVPSEHLYMPEPFKLSRNQYSFDFKVPLGDCISIYCFYVRVL